MIFLYGRRFKYEDAVLKYISYCIFKKHNIVKIATVATVPFLVTNGIIKCRLKTR